MKNALYGMLLALQFLTRLPIPVACPWTPATRRVPRSPPRGPDRGRASPHLLFHLIIPGGTGVSFEGKRVASRSGGGPRTRATREEGAANLPTHETSS